jgi:hypothetical protein
MAAFQGWAAGPNFSGAAQNMAQAVQVEEQRKARQSKQLQEVFKSIGDSRRRKEDQRIAADTATTALEESGKERALKLFTALGTRIDSLQSQAPKNSDFLSNPDEYEPALALHNKRVQRLIDQQNQFVEKNDFLKALLPASTATTGGGGIEPQLAGGNEVDAVFNTAIEPAAGVARSGNAVTDAPQTVDNNRNILSRFGGRLGSSLAETLYPFNPNAAAGSDATADELDFFQKAAALGLDVKDLFNRYMQTKSNRPQGAEIPDPSVDQLVDNQIPGFESGSIYGEPPLAASLSGEEDIRLREDTPISTKRGIQAVVTNAFDSMPDFNDIGSAASYVADAIRTGVEKVMPEGLAERLATFGESNLKGEARDQAVISLKEIAEKSAQGAVVGIVGGMSVVLGLKALSTIVPGKRQAVRAAKTRYQDMIKRIEAKVKQQKLDAAYARSQKKLKDAATRKKLKDAEKEVTKLRRSQATRIRNTKGGATRTSGGKQATTSSYPGGGKFNPLAREPGMFRLKGDRVIPLKF